MNKESRKDKPKIFISYANDDSGRAKDIAKELKKYNLETWLDEENISAGQNWRSEIENAIESCDFALVLISSKAFSSEWVKKEWTSLCEEKWKRPNINIIPIKLEDSKTPPFLCQYQSYNLKGSESYYSLINDLLTKTKKSGFNYNKKDLIDNEFDLEVDRLEERIRNIKKLLKEKKEYQKESKDDQT
ncbi:MAG: toll/interleukin-1 receptor domain-containing protein [Thiothrix sp.]|uniref:toll/interleukin-1 receptor domain-containing protein n=1 Tax=Thiothrix sp. TaxID=1032 RepID=UPI002618807F|nr:toll/interleukin-1 receptor domain-containing protein [Thiothrix sp.]MDD5393699.1 toll/interleukin-1 receptor domain-containing protein [Thiothrix sp.]